MSRRDKVLYPIQQLYQLKSIEESVIKITVERLGTHRAGT